VPRHSPKFGLFPSISSSRIAGAALAAGRDAGIAGGAAARNGSRPAASVGWLCFAGSSSAMILRMEARISSIDGSCLAGCVIACPSNRLCTQQNQRHPRR
jgi:hypothetical protein